MMEIYGFCIDNNSSKFRRILATVSWLGGLMTLTKLRIAVEVDDYDISWNGYIPDNPYVFGKPLVIDGNVIVNGSAFDVYRLLANLLKAIGLRINAEVGESEDPIYLETYLHARDMQASLMYDKKADMLCMYISFGWNA